jgi:hypothetical protein
VSDLQCPARFLLVLDGRPDEALPAEGVAAVEDLSGGETDPLTALEELSDLHRGELVVVRLAPDAAARLPGWLRHRATGGVVAAEVDADGWRVGESRG